ncbi:MAG TPA: PhnD/SsuA/transferrin family substrate-binding protein [Nodularia sp. (in: cyanobacteria)]|nr:PhnD/SsuA/transferrin family substrate-binding protein [Nodularia sp. (in: cyanobacteria)]
MDKGTEKNIPDWLNPDVLIVFIDELREAGYKIGIPQYIAAQDLILMLIAQGKTLDSPEQLRNLLGPIFCSSPIEQEEFQQRFERWVKLFNKAHTLTKKVDVEAEALSAELETERALFYRMQSLTLLISITIFISIIVFPSHTNQEPVPKEITSSIPTFRPQIPPAPETLPTVVETEPSKTPPPNPLFNWQIQLFLLIVVIFLVWQLWWLWRANLFLQRHSTTQKPELQTISITGFEENLFPSLVLLKIARSLRYRIRVPSHEIDVNKTLDATLKQGGWLTPVYRNYQVIPEYLFLVNRTSYRDHQAKFIEEIIKGLKQEGVFITIYFFDDDPQICFADNNQNYSFRLREIISKYSEHSLVMISDTEKFFSSISGELEPWVNQLTSWEKRAFLTPTPVESWGYQELELAQEFILLPATIKGLEVLSQRLRQGWATYFVGEEMQIPLPDSLRTRPYLWIERNPPPTEQINAMLESLEEYLGKHGFYWLSACAVFPELHWNITIYLGNVLKIESGASLIEVCSLTDLARLPWLRYGYMPDWLRVFLITTLTPEQKQIIRIVLQGLLITAVQGSMSKLQLEVAREYRRFLPKLVNPILYLLSKKAAVDSQLRDYIFLGFMRGKSVLAMRVSDEFSRSLQKQKRYAWWRKVIRKLGIKVKPPIKEPSFTGKNSSPSLISRRRFLQMLVWGGGGLLISVVANQISKINPRPPLQNGTLTIGVLFTNNNSAENYKGLKDYLEKELRPSLGQVLQVQIDNQSDSLQDLKNNIIDKKFDIVFTVSPAVSVVAEDNDYEFIARMYPNNNPYFDATIFVRKDSPIKRKVDITSDKTVALGDFDNVPAFYMPIYDLYGKTIRVSKDNLLEQIIQKVKSGEADVGAGVYPIIKNNPDLRVIERSKVIPVAGVYLSPPGRINKREYELIKKAFIDAPLEVQKKANYIKSNKLDYQQFKKIAERVETVIQCTDWAQNPIELFCEPTTTTKP